MAHFCRNCGTQLEPGSRFCPNCGTRVSTVEDLPRTDPEPGQAAPQDVQEPRQAAARPGQESGQTSRQQTRPAQEPGQTSRQQARPAQEPGQTSRQQARPAQEPGQAARQQARQAAPQRAREGSSQQGRSPRQASAQKPKPRQEAPGAEYTPAASGRPARRRSFLLPVVLVLLLIAAGTAWFFLKPGETGGGKTVSSAKTETSSRTGSSSKDSTSGKKDSGKAEEEEEKSKDKPEDDAKDKPEDNSETTAKGGPEDKSKEDGDSASSGGKEAGDSGTADEALAFTEDSWFTAGDYRLEKNWTSMQIAEGTLTEENRSIEAGNVRMTVEEGWLPEDAKAEIRKVPGTVPYTVDGATVPLTLYEFNAEGISDETFMTLEIPAEKPDGGEVGCGWYDEATGTLWPVSFDYDESRGVAVIQATHLSTYCGFPIKDEYTKNAMIAYLSNDELDAMFEKMNGDKGLASAVKAMTDTLEGESDDWEIGMQVANDLGTANMIVGSMVSVADAIGGLEKSMVFADGAGNSYVKNSIGTVGEIMNTNWGKAGSMPKWFRNYHGKAVSVPMTDKLKSVYPYNDINRIGNNITKVNIALSAFKIIDHALKGDSSGAAWEAAQLGIDRTLNFLASDSYGIALPGLSTYMVGVGLFAYALNEFYTEAITGRQQVYINAYTKYYQTKGTDGGYRGGDQWVLTLEKIIKNSEGTEDASEKIRAELDRYVNEFWGTYGDTAYLVNVMTEDEKIAWGAAGEGGLKEADKKKISESYKADLIPIIENAMAQVNRRNREAAKEEFKKAYELMRRRLNRKFTVHISDGTKEGEESKYAGCVVRFAGIYENQSIKAKKQYEAVLDKNGSAEIRMTLLSHILTNAGDVMQIVARSEKDETGELKVLGEHKFSLESPDPNDPFCIFRQDELEEEKAQEKKEEENKPGSGRYEMYMDYEFNLPYKKDVKDGPDRPCNNIIEVFDDDTFEVELPPFSYEWTASNGKDYRYIRQTSLSFKGWVAERRVSEGLTVVAGYVTEGPGGYHTDRKSKGYNKDGYRYPDGIFTERIVYTPGEQGPITPWNYDSEGEGKYGFYLMIYPKRGYVWLRIEFNVDEFRSEEWKDDEKTKENVVPSIKSIGVTCRLDKLEE